LSDAVVQGLLPLLSKETSEIGLSSMIDALITHQGILLKEGFSVDDKIQKYIITGLSEKRPKVKSAWAVAVSQLIWNFGEPSHVTSPVISFSKSVSKLLCSTFHEIVVNAIQASQNSAIISGYAISAATLGRWLEWDDEELIRIVKSEGILNITISVAPKPSFLLNDRIYTKLATVREQLWAINALEAAACRAITEMESAWSLAAVYFAVNPKLAKEVRFAALAMLKRVLVRSGSKERGQAVDYIIHGLEDWVRQVCEERKEGPASSLGKDSLTRLKEIVSTILSKELTSDGEFVRHALLRLFVLCHHPRLSRQQWSWIDISRHAGVDPGHVAGTAVSNFIKAIREKMWPKEKASSS
jgi:hypothetical protein